MSKMFIVIILIIAIVSTGLFIYKAKTNINSIDGYSCYKTWRSNIEIPYCNDLKECLIDCKNLNVKYYEINHRDGRELCYCRFENNVANIW